MTDFIINFGSVVVTVSSDSANYQLPFAQRNRWKNYQIQKMGLKDLKPLLFVSSFTMVEDVILISSLLLLVFLEHHFKY